MELVAQKLLSPAKINLMLRVTGQRSDGYHQLQTCFQILQWGDDILFEPLCTDGDKRIEIIGFDDLADEDNLIFQAAQMIKPWAQGHSDWRIKVNKKIPLGSGLGGGSSNAATTLKFLNQAWGCDLSTFDLLAMSVKLGADVPVFILGQGALATGIGETLTPMSFNTPYILLLLPKTHVNTAELFGSKLLNRKQSILSQEQLHEESFWINDFFPVVLHEFPVINDIYQNLKQQIELRLSGSGSAMFAIYNSLDEAELARDVAQQVCEVVLVTPTQRTE